MKIVERGEVEVSIYFIDTSALIKRYVSETGTSWVISWIEPNAGNSLIISELAYVEVRSVLVRYINRGSLTPSQTTSLTNDFVFHYYREYRVIRLRASTIQDAAHLLDKHRANKLRTLDAIQLSSAIQASRLLNTYPISLVQIRIYWQSHKLKVFL